MGMGVHLEGILNVEAGEGGFSYRLLQIQREGAVETEVVGWISAQAKPWGKTPDQTFS